MLAHFTPALIPPHPKFGLTPFRAAITTTHFEEKKNTRMIFLLYYFLYFLYFFLIIYIYQSITIALFSSLSDCNSVVKSFSACYFSYFSSPSSAHVGVSSGEFSEKFSSANISTSKISFSFSTCFLTKISIFEEIALFSWVKCIEIGTSKPPLGMGDILEVVLATVPVSKTPS